MLPLQAGVLKDHRVIESAVVQIGTQKTRIGRVDRWAQPIGNLNTHGRSLKATLADLKGNGSRRRRTCHFMTFRLFLCQAADNLTPAIPTTPTPALPVATLALASR